jgi:hypothetical protein
MRPETSLLWRLMDLSGNTEVDTQLSDVDRVDGPMPSSPSVLGGVCGARPPLGREPAHRVIDIGGPQKRMSLFGVFGGELRRDGRGLR